MSAPSSALKRYWLPSMFVCVVVAVLILVNLFVDETSVRDALDNMSSFLVMAAVALIVPRGLIAADGLGDRLRSVPEAYVAAAVGVGGAVAVAVPQGFWGTDPPLFLPIVSICVSALVALAIFRVQIRNERVAPHRMVPHTPDDLEQRFTAMARQLAESAAAFALLQAEVAARAQAAQELAREAEENRRHAEQSRTYAADQQAALEAVERLVAARSEPIIDAIERRSRRSQVIFLAVGALLGTVLQIVAERIF